MRIFTFILTLCISLLLLAGCDVPLTTKSDQVSVAAKSDQVNGFDTEDFAYLLVVPADDDAEIDNTERVTFTDDFYGYSIKYPSNWNLRERQTNFSPALISEGEGTLIEASGHPYDKDTSPPLTYARPLTLDSGEIASYFIEPLDKKVLIEMYVINSDRQIEYRVRGIMTLDYFSQHQKRIEAIFKSYQTFQGTR
ncbi:hypothetical protein [Gorillibacterium timonense]|uniref:hypothetical protein n=1 Tax=Gorillibacterium timonense TaxID=1689269 RepID=UPI00071D8905|nr:hypothetical protein [Gorillibacterium timonense]